MEIRSEILKTSLALEKLTAVFLGFLLDIEDSDSTRTLGNSSSSLSFNTKIDLLIDIGALNPETRNMFQTFMEVRNQFMHNINATSYEKCLSYIAGKENYLLKKYKQDTKLPKEDQLKNAVQNLSSDVLSITNEIVLKVREKNKSKAQSEAYGNFYKAFLTYFNSPTEEMNEYFEEEIKKDPTFTADRLRGIAFYMLNSIVKHITKDS